MTKLRGPAFSFSSSNSEISIRSSGIIPCVKKASLELRLSGVGLGSLSSSAFALLGTGEGVTEGAMVGADGEIPGVNEAVFAAAAGVVIARLAGVSLAGGAGSSAEVPDRRMARPIPTSNTTATPIPIISFRPPSPEALLLRFFLVRIRDAAGTESSASRSSESRSSSSGT